MANTVQLQPMTIEEARQIAIRTMEPHGLPNVFASFRCPCNWRISGEHTSVFLTLGATDTVYEVTVYDDPNKLVQARGLGKHIPMPVHVESVSNTTYVTDIDK